MSPYFLKPKDRRTAGLPFAVVWNSLPFNDAPLLFYNPLLIPNVSYSYLVVEPKGTLNRTGLGFFFVLLTIPQKRFCDWSGKHLPLQPGFDVIRWLLLSGTSTNRFCMTPVIETTWVAYFCLVEESINKCNPCHLQSCCRLGIFFFFLLRIQIQNWCFEMIVFNVSV